MTIYLDNSATTRVMDCAAKAALESMTNDYYNAASAYAPALRLDKRIRDARVRLGSVMGCTGDEIIYTSGGTESNNMALYGTIGARRGKSRVTTDMVEHPSVYATVQRMAETGAADAFYAGVDAQGRVTPEALEEALTPDTALVSVMHVNNETGAVNDIGELSALIRRRCPEAVFHVDGVQAFGKLNFAQLRCDMYSISGHKFHAPKGVGALMVRKGVRFAGGQTGGGQENGLRSGTTNAPGILGMDAALEVYLREQQSFTVKMRGNKLRLWRNLSSIPDVAVNGPDPEDGAPHILNVSFLGIRGEVLMNALSQQGIYVSTGSACSAKKQGKNRILTAMGVTGPRQEGAIRFSLCPFNTDEEMDTAGQIIKEQVAFLRRYRRR